MIVAIMATIVKLTKYLQCDGCHSKCSHLNAMTPSKKLFYNSYNNLSIIMFFPTSPLFYIAFLSLCIHVSHHACTAKANYTIITTYMYEP